MTRLYLVRHGENVANLTKEFSYKIVDYSLTPRGVLQAEQTALYFRGKQVDAVYSSPLKRAAETAQIIASEMGLPVVTMENFREVNVGDLELLPPTEENWRLYFRIVSDWENNKPETTFPGGEDYHTLVGRACEGIDAVLRAHPEGGVVVVAHGAILLATIGYISSAEPPASEYQNCAITEMEVSQDGERIRGKILQWAACEHLSGEAANLVSGIPDNVRTEWLERDGGAHTRSDLPPEQF